jgi:hypothetical protein
MSEKEWQPSEADRDNLLLRPENDELLSATRQANIELRAENERLRTLVKDLADDLEAELKGHYGPVMDYPSERRRFERDMANVYEARRAMEGKTACDEMFELTKIAQTACDETFEKQTEIDRLRAEIERLRAHMRALADTSVASDTAGIFKGLWHGSEQECERLRTEVERLQRERDENENLAIQRAQAAETEIEQLKADLVIQRELYWHVEGKE